MATEEDDIITSVYRATKINYLTRIHLPAGISSHPFTANFREDVTYRP